MTAVDDDVVLDAEPAMLDVSAFASADPAEGGYLPPPIAVMVADNDRTPGMVLTDLSGTASLEFFSRENDQAKFDVQLLSQPLAPVTVDFVPHDPRMSGVSVTFAGPDWNVRHELSMAVMDDSVHQGDVVVTVDVISHSTDAAYSEKQLPLVKVLVFDDD